MKTKRHLLIIICAILSQLVFSQDQSEKVENDIIKFTNGTVEEGKVILRGIHNPRKNQKIKLCDNNYENCTKYKLADIDEVVINSDLKNPINLDELYPNIKIGESIDFTKKVHITFKILYNPKVRSDTPLAGKLIFEGNNHNYYSFNTTMTDANTLRNFENQFVYITEKESNLIKYKFQEYINNKTTVNELKKLFSNCGGIIAESKKKGKVLRKKSILYFLEILDKCI